MSFLYWVHVAAGLTYRKATWPSSPGVSFAQAGPKNPHLSSACETFAYSVVLQAANSTAYAPAARKPANRLSGRLSMLQGV
jgi:hypothetical protein